MARADSRRDFELRKWSFELDYQKAPLASVLSVCGNTRVICAVSLERKVPGWMTAQNVPGGWITAEYQMLPSATSTRGEREVVKGRQNGRSAEIQRLVGRSLRAVVDLSRLPGLTLHIDCDVIDADGGTRCASISGASVALELAVARLLSRGEIQQSPLKSRVAAVSVGLLHGAPLLDLCYQEDHDADVDMNVVMSSENKYVEIQGSGEEATFSDEQLAVMLNYARHGLHEIFDKQQAAMRSARL